MGITSMPMADTTTPFVEEMPSGGSNPVGRLKAQVNRMEKDTQQLMAEVDERAKTTDERLANVKQSNFLSSLFLLLLLLLLC